MTAVDQAGNKVARYRCRIINGFESLEITVNADQRLTDELVLAIAMAAGKQQLTTYFHMPGN